MAIGGKAIVIRHDPWSQFNVTQSNDTVGSRVTCYDVPHHRWRARWLKRTGNNAVSLRASDLKAVQYSARLYMNGASSCGAGSRGGNLYLIRSISQ